MLYYNILRRRTTRVVGTGNIHVEGNGDKLERITLPITNPVMLKDSIAFIEIRFQNSRSFVAQLKPSGRDVSVEGVI